MAQSYHRKTLTRIIYVNPKKYMLLRVNPDLVELIFGNKNECDIYRYKNNWKFC